MGDGKGAAGARHRIEGGIPGGDGGPVAQVNGIGRGLHVVVGEINCKVQPRALAFGEGDLRAVGGGFEAAAGYSLATASAAFGAASSWTGVGLVAGAAGTAGGIAVGAHGIDQFQAGVRQAFTDQQVDSLTSVALQETTGMSQNTANLVDTGISVVGSMGAGTATAGIRAAHIAATDDLAQGLTRMQILSRWESGSRALNADDWAALGRQATSPLDKARMIEQGVNAVGQPYQLTTTFMQRIGQSTRLAPTGLTPYGAAGAGVAGAGLAGASSVARPPK